MALTQACDEVPTAPKCKHLSGLYNGAAFQTFNVRTLGTFEVQPWVPNVPTQNWAPFVYQDYG